MSYFDKYSERIRAQGTLTARTGEDRLTNSLRRDWDTSISAVKVAVRTPEGALKNVRIQTARKTVGMDKIYVHPDDQLHSGDIIVSLQDFSWLILDTKLIGQVYKQANMVRINRIIKWVKDGIIYEQAVRVKNFSRVDGVDDYYFFTMPENTVNIFLPLNEKTATIRRDERFMIDGFPYKVTRLDSFSYTGVIVLYIVEDIRNPGDTDEIADYVEPIPPITNDVFIEGPSEIPYGLDAIYTVSTANTTVPATWNIPTESWFTVTELGLALGVQITIKRDKDNIGKSIELEAEYDGETYNKLILVRSLV